MYVIRKNFFLELILKVTFFTILISSVIQVDLAIIFNWVLYQEKQTLLGVVRSIRLKT